MPVCGTGRSGGTQVPLELEPMREGHDNRCYWVKGAATRAVCVASDALSALGEAMALRHTAAHALNEVSSRSHCVISLERRERRQLHRLQRTGASEWRYRAQPQQLKTIVTRANLVDLAGSEDQRETQTSGGTLREAADINRSLFGQ